MDKYRVQSKDFNSGINTHLRLVLHSTVLSCPFVQNTPQQAFFYWSVKTNFSGILIKQFKRLLIISLTQLCSLSPFVMDLEDNSAIFQSTFRDFVLNLLVPGLRVVQVDFCNH